MTVPLKDIFLKDINRHIDGVIKADDTESPTVELNEYVVTKEVSKRLQAFLDAYNGGSYDHDVQTGRYPSAATQHGWVDTICLISRNSLHERSSLPR